MRCVALRHLLFLGSLLYIVLPTYHDCSIQIFFQFNEVHVSKITKIRNYAPSKGLHLERGVKYVGTSAGNELAERS